MAETKNKKQKNLRCNECEQQVSCSDIKDGLEQFNTCGQDNGSIDDSCRINLQIDGKDVFEISRISNEMQTKKPLVNESKSTPKKSDKNFKKSSSPPKKSDEDVDREIEKNLKKVLKK